MRKLSCKNLLVWLTGLAVLSATAIGFVVSSNVQSKTNTFVKNATTIFTSKNIGNKVGTIRHWQNNNFSGIEVKNGGFVALTGTNSATRIDAFGNIIWEFNPSSLSSSGYQNVQEFSAKKVVEVAQDESNANVLYLLLVPTDAPDSNLGNDAADKHYYNEMKSDISKQATIVQITENLTSYSGSTWTPSFTINNHININPEKMVNNYPPSWKTPASSVTSTTDSNNGPTFFSKTDHPSWYVTNSGDKVSSASESSKSSTTQEKTVTGTTMVLPWKQYITNLGNMYAKDNKVFIFGGNGSMYNDPEALSIGMFRVDFSSSSKTVTGIPYAYLLSNLKYDPVDESGSKTPSAYWNKCFAPIRQDENFNYVPRLAVAGIQTNITTNDTNLPFLYLGGAITVGQVENSQNKAWKPNVNQNQTSNSHSAAATTKSLQQQRSLQLSGQNILSGPTTRNLSESSTPDKKQLPPDRNSIDPCLLFGTAFNLEQLKTINVPKQETPAAPAGKADANAITSFQNVLMDNQYFDIGSTIGNSSTAGTYYFFDHQRRILTCNNSSASSVTSSEDASISSDNVNRLAFNPWIASSNSGNAPSLIFPYTTGALYGVQNKSPDAAYALASHNYYNFFNELGTSSSSKSGKVYAVLETQDPQISSVVSEEKSKGKRYEVLGTSMASYSWNLPMLVDNAKNYYYPTLCYGYSLKSIASLTKVKTTSQVGYAMQVGKSILFINEPKFIKASDSSSSSNLGPKIDNVTNLVYHGPTSVSIGDQETFGEAKFGNSNINNQTENNKYVYKYNQWEKNIQIAINSSQTTTVENLTNRPFSASSNFALDKAIVSLGMSQLVAAIKDFNYTVSQIAGTFKISADPYASSASVSKNSSLNDPTLSWNKFMGLGTTNDGSSVVSSWSEFQVNNNSRSSDQSVIPNRSITFALTNYPIFSDYNDVAWTGGTDGEIMRDQVFRDSTFLLESGVSRAWFETCNIGTGNTTIETMNGVFKNTTSQVPVTKNQYFSQPSNGSNNNNPTLIFENTNFLGSTPLMYGQSPNLANATSGIAYLRPDVSGSSYMVYNKPDATKVLGNATFKDLSVGNLDNPGFLSKQLSDILEQIQGATTTYLVKKQYVNELINVTNSTITNPQEQPTLQNGSTVIIVASDVDLNNQTAIFSVYFWNPITKTYDMSITQGNRFKKFTFGQTPNQITPPNVVPDGPSNGTNSDLSQDASTKNNNQWLLIVVITIPLLLIVISTIVGVTVSKKRKANRIRRLAKLQKNKK